MAQQSARRDWKNQNLLLCLEHVCLIWIRSANSHTGQQHLSCTDVRRQNIWRNVWRGLAERWPRLGLILGGELAVLQARIYAQNFEMGE